MPDVRELIAEGNALAKKKKWEEALERYQAAVKIDPGDADLHFLIGCCHFKMNHGSAAREAWSRTLELKPDHQKARTWIHRVTGMTFETPAAA